MCRYLDLGMSSFCFGAVKELNGVLPLLPKLQLCIVTLPCTPEHNAPDLNLHQVRTSFELTN